MKLDKSQVSSISLLSVIVSSERSTLYLGDYLGTTIIVEYSDHMLPMNPDLKDYIFGYYFEDIRAKNIEENEDIFVEKIEPISDNLIVYQYADVIIPQFNRFLKDDFLVDPYTVLFLNPGVLESPELSKFKGNAYPTLLVYNYFDLPVGENSKYFETAEMGLPETLDTNFYNIYKNNSLEKIPEKLISTLIYRGIISFKTSSGQPIRIHPNISQTIDLSNMLLETIFIKNYKNFVLDDNDFQSVLEPISTYSRFLQDGLMIPPYAKDYIEYINMNLDSILYITRNPSTKLEEVPDSNIFSTLGIYYLYCNRQDLISKAKIYLGILPGTLVFKESGNICVGKKSKYDIISMSEIYDKIKQNNPKYDLLLIEILGLLTLYSVEEEKISKLLLKLLHQREKKSARVWETPLELPNIVNIRREHTFVENSNEDYTNFDLSYNLENLDMYTAGNALENIIRRIIVDEFSPEREDPTIIREYIDKIVTFDITVPYKVDILRVKQRLSEIDKTQEFKDELIKSEVKLPIITHMTFGLPGNYKKSEKFTTEFMKKALFQLVGDNYKLSSRVYGTKDKKVEYTITVHKVVDKKALKAKIRELTSTKEYRDAFVKMKK